MKVTLHIQDPGGPQEIEVGRELSIGRTDLADLVLEDSGLSRVNTTFFVEGDEALLTDDNSTNGTFLNGEKISGRPKVLRDGDQIRIGSFTTIRVEIADGFGAAAPPRSVTDSTVFTPPVSAPNSAAAYPTINQPEESNQPPWLLIAAGLMTFLILLFGGLAYWLVSSRGDGPKTGPGPKQPPVVSDSAIPVRVIDPLGGEDEEDLDDLIASWETAEEEIKAENVADIAVVSGDAEIAELNVTAAMLADRQKKAFEPRSGETGIRPAGMNVPKELFGDGVIKQKAKLRTMNTGGYRQPLDFAELADKRMKRELIEMPMAANSFYLDVGGSAQDRPFSAFSFDGGNADILPGTPKFQILSTLAENFAGQKYDLNNAAHRKQMRMRLLRMFNPSAKPILKELADAYFGKFARPLRVTSLTRSIDYQILLNAGNANSFKVRGEGSLPPHTSGCAFDLARKHMNADEQNFVMNKLAEMEQAGKLDALIEYGVNACFHIFIYNDGIPPKM
ncbi:MAG: DUF5715 family protein [Pyrinomonadaceae bacterium]